MKEEALVFSCEGDHLLAVLTPRAPDAPAALADVGVVIIVGGPQYRAGSHRQYVQLARSLAGHGVTALRFDTRGMGDSSGAQRTLEEIESDVGAAVDALQAARPEVQRVVLWGLCGGASAALLYWRRTQDPRIQGMVLVNPWVRTEGTLARTHLKHYYLKRLGQREFWAKLLSGRVAGKAFGDLMNNIRLARGSGVARQAMAGPPATGAADASPAGDVAVRRASADSGLPLQSRMALAWKQHPGPKLVVLSGNDFTAKEFLETAASDRLWKANLAQPHVTRFDVEGADHTFSDPQAQRAVEARTLAWVQQALASARSAAG